MRHVNRRHQVGCLSVWRSKVRSTHSKFIYKEMTLARMESDAYAKELTRLRMEYEGKLGPKFEPRLLAIQYLYQLYPHKHGKHVSSGDSIIEAGSLACRMAVAAQQLHQWVTMHQHTAVRNSFHGWRANQWRALFYRNLAEARMSITVSNDSAVRVAQEEINQWAVDRERVMIDLRNAKISLSATLLANKELETERDLLRAQAEGAANFNGNMADVLMGKFDSDMSTIKQYQQAWLNGEERADQTNRDQAAVERMGLEELRRQMVTRDEEKQQLESRLSAMSKELQTAQSECAKLQRGLKGAEDTDGQLSPSSPSSTVLDRRWIETQKELEGVNAVLKATREELETSKHACASLQDSLKEAALKALNDKRQSGEELQARQEKIAGLEDVLFKLEASLAQQKEEEQSALREGEEVLDETLDEEMKTKQTKLGQGRSMGSMGVASRGRSPGRKGAGGLHEKIAELEGELSTTREELETSRSECAREKQQSEEALSAVRKELEAAVAGGTTQAQAQQEKLEALRKQLEGTEKERVSLLEDKRQLEQAVEAAQQDARNAEDALSAAQQELEELFELSQGELEAARTECANQTKEKEALQQQLESVEEHGRLMSQEKDKKLEEALNRGQAEVEGEKQKQQQLEQALNAMQEQLEVSKRECVDLQGKLDKKDEDFLAEFQAVNQEKDDLAALNAQLCAAQEDLLSSPRSERKSPTSPKRKKVEELDAQVQAAQAAKQVEQNAEGPSSDEFRQRINQVFASLDVDGSGQLDVAEIIAAHGNAGGDAEALFSNLDKDSDGMVTEREFRKFFGRLERKLGIEKAQITLSHFEQVCRNAKGTGSNQQVEDLDAKSKEAQEIEALEAKLARFNSSDGMASSLNEELAAKEAAARAIQAGIRGRATRQAIKAGQEGEGGPSAAMEQRISQVFASLDVNRSGQLEIAEVIASHGSSGGDAEALFSNLDKDSDGMVTEREFRKFFGRLERKLGIEKAQITLSHFEQVLQKKR